MYEFAYCFCIDGRVQWSAETAQSLERRLEGTLEEHDFLQMVEFIETARPGEFITINLVLKKTRLITKSEFRSFQGLCLY